MTALTVIGATAGLLVLVLMALAPVLVELNERHPVQPRKQPVCTEARPQKPVRVSAVVTSH